MPFFSLDNNNNNNFLKVRTLLRTCIKVHRLSKNIVSTTPRENDDDDNKKDKSEDQN